MYDNALNPMVISMMSSLHLSSLKLNVFRWRSSVICYTKGLSCDDLLVCQASAPCVPYLAALITVWPPIKLALYHTSEREEGEPYKKQEQSTTD